ncbi:MAG: zinc-dependent metalloprotease [Nocardioidaceae bacterium]
MPARTMIDWDLAVSTASRLAGPGPVITRPDADAVVAELKADADRSTGLVRDFTGLEATGPSGSGRTAPVLVVDRTGWVQANADGFADLMGPLVEKMQSRKGAPGPVTEAVGSKVTGVEVGGLLGFMASKVLGQFDPFYAGPGVDGATPSTGRLLLVAPNIVHVENELEVDRTDFRLWVCLHEETHRVQFTAVPWMRDHIKGEIDAMIGAVDLDPGKVASMLGDAVKRMGDLVRGDDEVSLLDLFSTPEQRVVMDRLTGVMSLLEGHADVVMDGVGPSVIPSVEDIRAKFNQRRKGAGYVDRVLRRLLGMDAKMAQYRDGAAFVHAVVDRVGMADFNAVWAEPANLPSKAEIGDPQAWVRRVHG